MVGGVSVVGVVGVVVRWKRWECLVKRGRGGGGIKLVAVVMDELVEAEDKDGGGGFGKRDEAVVLCGTVSEGRECGVRDDDDSAAVMEECAC